MAFDFAEFHRQNRAKIIREWVGRLHTEVGAQYSRRPLNELRGTVSEAFDADVHAITYGDYTYLDRFIDKITRMRLEAGFLLSDVQKAFEIYRAVTIPLLANKLPIDEYRDCVAKINHCLAYTMHRFSDHFQEMHENQLKEHNRRLQEEVRASTAQLRESEAKYKTLVEEINDGYFVIQDEGIVFANRAYCEMHGYALHEVLGQRYYALVAPGSRQRVIEIYRGSHQEGGAPAVFEYMRLHKDGRTFPTEITAKVVRYEKRFSNIGLCRDISKRVEMERRMRESERMAYVGQITTSLSHEIRNPLSAVKLNLQILSKNPQLRGNDQRRIDISVKEVIRLEGILTELLDFAKPLQMEFAGCGVNRVLSSCAELLEMRFKEKGLSLVQKFDSRIPEIQGDGERLGQAFINLLLNAMEASPVGGKVWVKTQYHPRGPAQSIRIAFEDEGAGVPGETLDDIFKPFFTTKTRGTGLGLANVKRIVEAHGGRVKVVGRQSRGASFQVRLPVRREHG